MPFNINTDDPADDISVLTEAETREAIAGASQTTASIQQIIRNYLVDSSGNPLTVNTSGKLVIPGVSTPPPPPPPTSTPYISKLTDIDYLHWEPSNSGNPAVPSNSSFHTITAPSGPGFEFVCTDANQTAWNNQYKAVLAQKNGTTALGQTQDWTWDMQLPTQTINKYQACFIQFHPNSDSSGHFIGIDQGSMTYRLGRQSAPGQVYAITVGVTPVIFDRWVPFRIQVKWSLGGDGFVRYWIDNKQVLSFSGPTQFAGEGQPYLQIGWYGQGGSGNPSGVANTVRFANIQRTVS